MWIHVRYTTLIYTKLYKCFESVVEQADFKNMDEKLTGLKYEL
jgi:hypothetical protein